MTDPANQPSDVWLRGNRRVAAGLVGLSLACGAVAAAAAVAVGLSRSGGPAWWAVAAVAGTIANGLALMAWASARPRLMRQGDRIVVQVAPFAREAVPIDVVECVFPGSNPLTADGTPAGDGPASFRVGTLVLRLAERALDYRSRDTFAPWVMWSDGNIVLDGRWCEPLSPAVARTVGTLLMEAKRGVALTKDAP